MTADAILRRKDGFEMLFKFLQGGLAALLAIFFLEMIHSAGLPGLRAVAEIVAVGAIVWLALYALTRKRPKRPVSQAADWFPRNFHKVVFGAFLGVYFVIEHMVNW
ncbi:hypothetical protein DZK27_02435 [Rhodobacteraceae bacterium 63075]|nr:hypothetical protein DZK27_02435 [Rhodobacteraceae bacterium 63075]